MSVKKWFKDFFSERPCQHIMLADPIRHGLRCVKTDCDYFISAEEHANAIRKRK